MGSVLKRHSVVILFPSAYISGFAYCIAYTAVGTFTAAPYLYNAFEIGLVLLSLGIGNMGGSALGGRWLDYVLSSSRWYGAARSSARMVTGQ